MADVVCYDDLDEFGRDLDDPVTELEQDVVHMLLESYRTNVDALERSIGLEDALSGPTDPGLRHRIETKLSDDPRIDAAKAVLTATDNQTVRVDLFLQVNGAELGISLEYDAAGNLKRIAT
jgi:hypothetical protein